MIRAEPKENQKCGFSPSEDSDQPRHVTTLINIEEHLCSNLSSYSGIMAFMRLGGNQADMSHQWAQIPQSWFCHDAAHNNGQSFKRYDCEPRHEKTCFCAYLKTKLQISCAVTAQLISAFVFATKTVPSLFLLNPKFQAPIYLLWLSSPVWVGPGRKTQRQVSHDAAHCLSIADFATVVKDSFMIFAIPEVNGRACVKLVGVS